MNEAANQIIDQLGGTAQVSRMFGLSMPSVSKWRHNGIPATHIRFLRVVRRKALAGLDLDAATAPKAKPTATA
jgi:hypothetical protein